MKKLSEINHNQVAKSNNYDDKCKFADELLPILEKLQENLPFFRQKSTTIALMMTAREWAIPLIKSGYTILDCDSAYALIILLGLKDLQLADLIRVIAIQRRYRKEDINQARKIILEDFSKNTIADLAELVKPIAYRNAIERENRIRVEHENSLKIEISPESKARIKKENKQKTKYTLEMLREMFCTSQNNTINF